MMHVSHRSLQLSTIQQLPKMSCFIWDRTCHQGVRHPGIRLDICTPSDFPCKIQQQCGHSTSLRPPGSINRKHWSCLFIHNIQGILSLAYREGPGSCNILPKLGLMLAKQALGFMAISSLSFSNGTDRCSQVIQCVVENTIQWLAAPRWKQGMLLVHRPRPTN